jgi:uncharacterized protein YukE
MSSCIDLVKEADTLRENDRHAFLYNDHRFLFDEAMESFVNMDKINNLLERIRGAIGKFFDSILGAVNQFFRFISSLPNPRMNVKAMKIIEPEVKLCEEDLNNILQAMNKSVQNKEAQFVGTEFDQYPDIFQDRFSKLDTEITKAILENSDKQKDYIKWDRQQIAYMEEIPRKKKQEASQLYDKIINTTRNGKAPDIQGITNSFFGIIMKCISIMEENLMKIIDKCKWSPANSSLDIEPTEVQIEI